jgi:DeoR family fructose operon transcriptional repressor
MEIVNSKLAETSRNYHGTSQMQAEARKKAIENYLQKVEFVSLDELSQELDVSVSTVRRDVTALEALGSVKRTHGGARLLNPRSDEFTFTKRDTVQLDAKEAIGRSCADLIESNQSVIIDAGTTVFHVATYLESKAPQIVTNSLPVANLYAANNRAEVILSGGVIYPRLGVLVGPLAVETFSKMHVDVAVMSSGGITEDGITNSHILLIDIQRAMLRAASKVVMCLDSSKFGRRSVAPLCGLDEVDVIVTDKEPSADFRLFIEERGGELIVAPSG